MATNNIHYDQNRNMSELFANLKDELKDFISTRVQMLRAEMSEKAQAVKAAVPAIAVGAVMLVVSFFLFTGLLVTVIAQAIHNNWAYPIAFAVVFVLYALIGAALAAYGIRTLKASGMAPERTMRVLKQDQVWLQTEARTQL
jgi:protein-S-isoprenylcysteine O-methyltransferase Ste14